MPYVIIMASSFPYYSPTSKDTYVGDKSSDPKLMALLDAELIKNNDDYRLTGNSFYKTLLSPRQVLDRLEVQGYKVVGMTIGDNQSGNTQWTLYKPSTSSV